LSEEIDLLIRRKEIELLPLCSQMEKLKTQFTDETAIFASKWYQETAAEYIAKYSEITLSMSEEKLVSMKTKIGKLVESSEKIVKDELGNPELWWHLRPHLHDSIEQYTQVADKYPEILDRAVRRALGHLGVILEEFKFHVIASGNTGSYQEFWFDHEPITNRIVPFYPHLIIWAQDMQETIKIYNIQFTQAIVLFNEIQKLKEQKKRQQALSRWKSL